MVLLQSEEEEQAQLEEEEDGGSLTRDEDRVSREAAIPPDHRPLLEGGGEAAKSPGQVVPGACKGDHSSRPA